MTTTACLLYARYSAGGQNPRSVDDQLADCRAFAASRGWTVLGEYADRAALLEAAEQLAAQAAVVGLDELEALRPLQAEVADLEVRQARLLAAVEAGEGAPAPLVGRLAEVTAELEVARGRLADASAAVRQMPDPEHLAAALAQAAAEGPADLWGLREVVERLDVPAEGPVILHAGGQVWPLNVPDPRRRP